MVVVVGDMCVVGVVTVDGAVVGVSDVPVSVDVVVCVW